jgi:DNA polymerase alpha subunit A
VTGFTCVQCDQRMPVASLAAQMTYEITQHIMRYQMQIYQCDDITCGTRTGQVSVLGKPCLVPTCRGSMRQEYSYEQLFTQLDYYDWLVNLERWHGKHEGEQDEGAWNMLQAQYFHECAELRKIVSRYMSKSDRFKVSMMYLFGEIGLGGEGRSALVA